MPSVILSVAHGPIIPSLQISLGNVFNETDITSTEYSEASDIYDPGLSELIRFTQSELLIWSEI